VRSCMILLVDWSKVYAQVTGVLLLCGVGLVVHEEKFEIADVVDEESLVAGGHHVARLPVVAETDLRAG